MSVLPVGILLAAGQSRRFGSNKLLHPIIDDTPMLLVSAAKLAEALPLSFVVINKDLLGYREKLESLGLQVVVNEQAEQGMGSSLACGVAAIGDADGWLIALADMPYVSVETIKVLARRFQAGSEIVAPIYKKQRGHPVVFSSKFKNELLALDADVGAKDIIARHEDKLVLIDTEDEGCIIDIDYMDGKK